MHTVTTTKHWPADELLDAWSDHVHGNFPGLKSEPLNLESFTGGTSVTRANDFQLVKFWSDDARYRRGAGALSDEILMVMPVRGTFTIRIANVDVDLPIGTIGTLSAETQFELRHGAGVGLVLSAPSNSFMVEQTWTKKSAVMSLDSGLGAVLRQSLMSVAAAADGLTEREFTLVCQHATQLLAECSSRGIAEDRLTMIAKATLTSITMKAHEPSLDVKAVARETGWSVRQIQLALQHIGTTPTAAIREARLERAQQLLGAHDCRHWHIARIAYSAGFASVRTFNSTFKSRFSMTPNEYRRSRNFGGL